MDLVPGDHISDCIAFTGLYEPEVTHRIVDLARQGGTLIDIGANLGYFALLWTALNPQNKCIAFEASPRNIDIIQRNIDQSGLKKQVKLFPVAAGTSSGKLRFDVGPTHQTGWGGLTYENGANSIEVDVIRVDEVITSDEPITILKVDIEGADTWALMGCERLLKAKAIQEIWYEQNKPRMAALGISLEATQKYLQSVGYKSKPINNPNSEVVEWSAVRL